MVYFYKSGRMCEVETQAELGGGGIGLGSVQWLQNCQKLLRSSLNQVVKHKNPVIELS